MSKASVTVRFDAAKNAWLFAVDSPAPFDGGSAFYARLWVSKRDVDAYKGRFEDLCDAQWEYAEDMLIGAIRQGQLRHTIEEGQ